MTAPLQFTSPARDHESNRTPFQLDDELLYAIKPKTASLVKLMKSVNTENEDDPRNVDALDEFIDLCMEPASAKIIRDRMDDPDDGFDLDTLVEIMEALQAAWTDRPTGPSSGSSGRRATPRSGRRSTANARSVG